MTRPNILMLLDIDGVLVQSFKDTVHNPIKYAELVKDQPINFPVLAHIKTWYEQTPANITIKVVTKRKASLLKETTDIQLDPIWRYIDEFIYYPEDRPFQEHDTTWKNEVFESRINKGTWDQIIIVEDDINQLTSLTFSLKILEFWLVLYNEFLIKSKYILHFPKGD